LVIALPWRQGTRRLRWYREVVNKSGGRWNRRRPLRPTQDLPVHTCALNRELALRDRRCDQPN